MNVPYMERPIHRFPRTDDEVTLYVAKLRAKYPAPAYNQRTDGSWNPGSWILKWSTEQRSTKLRELCDRHALKTTGPKTKLIKRLYLHWRSSKLKLGKVYYGYSEGCENTRAPTCSCGFLKREDIEATEKKRELQRETTRAQRKGSFQKAIPRFPRTIRFPRLRFPRPQ